MSKLREHIYWLRDIKPNWKWVKLMRLGTEKTVAYIADRQEAKLLLKQLNRKEN